MNRDLTEWQKFRFSQFDANNEGKITESGLFKFVKDTSVKLMHMPAVPTEILKRDQFDTDVFIAQFSNDFLRVARAFA